MGFIQQSSSLVIVPQSSDLWSAWPIVVYIFTPQLGISEVPCLGTFAVALCGYILWMTDRTAKGEFHFLKIHNFISDLSAVFKGFIKPFTNVSLVKSNFFHRCILKEISCTGYYLKGGWVHVKHTFPIFMCKTFWKPCIVLLPPHNSVHKNPYIANLHFWW